MSANDLTVAVLLTPPGRGAVATVVVEGPDAIAAVEACFQPAVPSRRLGGMQIVFGRWGGEEIVACRTAEQQVELHCHGGRAAAERLQRNLAAAGCRLQEWAAWLKEGAAGQQQLIAAEAAIALSAASTERTAAILLDQYHGAWQAEMEAIQRLVAANSADARQRVQAMLDLAPLGRHLAAPWRIVVAGSPNVGKSSLINTLVGYERAIVYDQPGTTRDVVTAKSAIAGWPVELSDTAGLRATTDELEAAGVSRAEACMKEADVLLLVFDASREWSTADATLVAKWPAALVLHNKADLPAAAGDRPTGLQTSTVTRQGIDELIEQIGGRIVPQPPPPGCAVPFTQEQLEFLEQALRKLQAQGA